MLSWIALLECSPGLLSWIALLGCSPGIALHDSSPGLLSRDALLECSPGWLSWNCSLGLLSLDCSRCFAFNSNKIPCLGSHAGVIICFVVVIDLFLYFGRPFNYFGTVLVPFWSRLATFQTVAFVVCWHLFEFVFPSLSFLPAHLAAKHLQATSTQSRRKNSPLQGQVRSLTDGNLRTDDRNIIHITDLETSYNLLNHRVFV